MTGKLKRFLAFVLSGAMVLTIVGNSENSIKAATVDENYAKLLQYALYFYDANMCGSGVDENSLLFWRGDCHTFDSTTYTRSDGTVASVNLSGGFHDAGDHVKFGITEAYAAFTLGMSYNTNKSAYESARQTGHLQDITTYFSDYLVNCTVLNSSGASVEAFCCQVGQGGDGYDHGYWGSPEAQTNTNRPIYFTSSSEPSTDIVSLSAAALAMQYMNFGGDTYLSTAKKLFEYAKNNSKKCNTTGSTFYVSTGWADDYCLAAILLYNLTGDTSYQTEYYKYCNDTKASNVYWPLGWDNTAPALAYYAGQGTKLSNIMNVGTNINGYRCVDSWGSARYNTSMQYTGLLYDKVTGTSTYKSFAESQMSYLLGNNNNNQCFVVGYNQYSSKYPHHRAASGYTGGPKGTTAQAHVLLGALVGGPKTDGSYTDSADDYQCNEVAIDYNATLVAAAAALYDLHRTETSTQYIDSSYYTDSNSGSGGGSGGGGSAGGSTSGTVSANGVFIASSDKSGIVAGLVSTKTGNVDLEYSWYACKSGSNAWELVQNWTRNNEWLNWKPDSYGDYVLVGKVRVAGKADSVVQKDTAVAYHPYIKGICQMPYTGTGGGYLIGIEGYNNYTCEMLILDCTLLAEGKDAWIYTTGKCGMTDKCLWTVWQPKYGYYWTLYRIYDSRGNIIDEACYGFVNAF